MKSTGIVRNVDDLGRLVLPKELRRSLSIPDGAPMEFFVDGNMLCVKKYDVVGDVDQLLDQFTQALRIKSDLLDDITAQELLVKAEEMKAILAESRK